jgi:hypothetical protein
LASSILNSGHDTYSLRGDSIALMRLEMNSHAGLARRAIHHSKVASREKIRQAALKEGKAMGGHRRPIMASVKEQVGALSTSNGR